MGIGRIRWVSELHGIANSPPEMIQIQSHDLLRVDALDALYGFILMYTALIALDTVNLADSITFPCRGHNMFKYKTFCCYFLKVYITQTRFLFYCRTFVKH